MLTFNFTFIQDTFLVTWLCCLMFFSAAFQQFVLQLNS